MNNIMKKLLLPALGLLFASISMAQNGRNQLTPATGLALKSKALPNPNQPKTMTCVDTLRYPQAKEQILGTNNFYNGFGVWQADNESLSMAFLNGGSMNITGIEFYGANDATNGTTSVTVNASIYNVNASYQPTTLIGGGTVTITATTYGYRYVTFASPVTVTGNYAVVLKPTNTNGVLNMFINDQLQGQPYDELFATFYSTYSMYPNPGVWNTIPVFSPGYNYEPIVAPIVNYSINTAFTTSANPVCLGTSITYTNTTTPAGVLTSRMNNYSVFSQYFGAAATDSTHVYSMGNGSPLIWSANTMYTHPAAGTYTVMKGTNGGFWVSCFDNSQTSVTITAPADASFTYASPSYCANATNPSPVFGTGSAGVFSSTTGLSINSATGEINLGASTPGTYTVTNTKAAAGGCPADVKTTSVTINAVDNATFTYASNTICQSAPNSTPTVSATGTFTSTPAGLIFANASTGEINPGASSNGTYSVTYTTSGLCPNTSNQTIVITSSQDASFTYASPSYCTNATNPTPVFGTGSAGTFSSTAGLSINSSTGEINLGASIAGTYTVTNTIPASGGCAADVETTSITINQAPAATVTGGGSFCVSGTATINIALTGSGPWDITYTDGVTPTTVNGVSASPYTFTTSTAGTYTVTAVTMAGCTATGTGTAVVTINPNPTVNFTAVGDLCDNASAVSLVATPAGGTFTGSTGISGNTFNPAGLSGSITLNYAYTDGNGCSGSATTTFNVNAAPTVTLSSFTAVCSNVAPFALTGGLPAGGTYTGTGVSGANFDPSAALIGSNAITYAYTDGNGCSASATQAITVNDCASLTEVANYELLVYPNPASQALFIKAGKDVTYSLITEDGKTVISATKLVGGQEITVETTQFARGMYYLQFIGENGIAVEKVLLK